MMSIAMPQKLKFIPDFRTIFFPGQRDVHYIGGSDILPAPLENQEEAKAISELGTGRTRRRKSF